QFATQISPTISQPSLAILLDEILLSAPGRRTPRLVVGNFILQGRRWLFVTSELKGMLDNLSTFASFERIQDWRRLHGVPACVTVRSALQSDFIVQYAKRSIRPAENGGDADRERESDFAGRPPLFIDFTNVLSLRLFERAVARAMEHVVIEEFLPTAESCPVEIEGRRHLMECVIECRNLLPESAGVQEDDKWNPLPPSL
ncbi:MAG: hypothetical protein KGQ94_11245, partial [Alphaproteobacteria bacterium]|nr:hypothetical protein [Alphaproteobacteria bacterium]